MPQPHIPAEADDPTGGLRPLPRPRPPAPPHLADEQDSSGRQLAMRLPAWDLLPPAEFLDRRPGRRP